MNNPDFAKTLRRMMNQAGMNAKTLAARSGLQPSSISQYLAGKTTPRDEAYAKIRAVLAQEGSCADISGNAANDRKNAPLEGKHDVLAEYLNVPVPVAAKLLGMSAGRLRQELQEKTLPIGTAIKRRERYYYHISPERLRQFLPEQAEKPRLTVEEAARALGMSEQLVRCGLQSGELEIGTALRRKKPRRRLGRLTHVPSDNYSYYINPRMLGEYTQKKTGG